MGNVTSKEPMVFMYHGVCANNKDIPLNREVGADIYDVSMENFTNQMEFLKKSHYTVDALEKRPNVVLTFDDGEMNNFCNVLKILNKFDFPAYFFITVNRIGRVGYMGWDELRILRDHGMLIGSHGLNHEVMVRLTNMEIEKELYDSKSILEDNLKVNVDYFSIPRGFINRKVIDVARARYKKIFVSELSAEKEGCMARVAVKKSWSLPRFEQALLGKIPLQESGAAFLKNIFKKTVGAGGYTQMRDLILRSKG